MRLGRAVREQTLERLRGLVLAHVEAYEPVGRPEEVLGQRLRDLRLPGARRADEEEHAQRPIRIRDAGLDHRDALDDALHCLGLLEDPALEERANVLERKRDRGVEER
jgi:hypothetical protein